MSGDPLIINLKPKIKSAIKIGFVFQGVLILLLTIALFSLSIQAFLSITIISILCIVGAIIYFIVGRNYLRNVFYKEQITVSKNELTIIYKSLGINKTYDFDLNDIKYFGHVGTVEYTEHPMNNPIIDFTGLGVGERELQFLIDDGTIEIATSDETIRFGKNMTSWDTEEIIEQIEQYTGKKFISKKPIKTEENE